MSWPKLSYGLASDVGHYHESSLLVKHLVKRFSKIDFVVVGDQYQTSTPVANLLRARAKAKVVLSPEGVGVFRSKYGGYRWREIARLSITATLAVDFFSSAKKTICANTENSTDPAFTFLWRVRRVLLLMRGYKCRGFDLLKLTEVDFTITPWGANVDFGISAKNSISVKPESAALRRRYSQAVKTVPDSACFVHQPLELSQLTWQKVLAPLRSLGINKLVIKVHRSDRGLPELVQGLEDALPEASLSVVYVGNAEELIYETCPAHVIGITSTVLLSVGLATGVPKIYSLASRVVAHATKEERGSVATFAAHQLKALNDILGDRITQLEQ